MPQWYYGSPAGQAGPVEERQLREMIAAGQLAPETLLWRDGMKDWTRLDSLPELYSLPSGPYPPPGTPYGGYPGYPPQVPTSNLAIASMVCGILCVFFCYLGGLPGIPAVICGHMALSAMNNPSFPVSGRGMAIAGLVLGYLGILFTLAAVTFAVIGVMNASP